MNWPCLNFDVDSFLSVCSNGRRTTETSVPPVNQSAHENYGQALVASPIEVVVVYMVLWTVVLYLVSSVWFFKILHVRRVEFWTDSAVMPALSKLFESVGFPCFVRCDRAPALYSLLTFRVLNYYRVFLTIPSLIDVLREFTDLGSHFTVHRSQIWSGLRLLRS